MDDFRRKVSVFYEKSRRAKRLVAKFFLTHPEGAAFLTLDELAVHIGVSAATITRTASEIGFAGYPGLQNEIRRSLLRKLAPVERLELQNLPTGSLGYRESIAVDTHNLGELANMNDDDHLEEAIRLLAESPRVYLVAARSSYGPISFLGFMLAQIRPYVFVMTEDEGRLPEQILNFVSGDLLLSLSLPRYSSTTLYVTEEARRHGCRVISVSDGPASPLARLADVALFVPYESYSFFNSVVGALALCNALVTSVNTRLGKTALDRLHEHDRLIDMVGALVKSDAANESN